MKFSKSCSNCRFDYLSKSVHPCNECNNYENWAFQGMTKTITEQPQEEINHPSRYAGGKYECIDVMLDVFGKEAVKHFCLLNAFKYIWRQEHKGGTEDIKKAVWYLNECIELEESEVKDES